MTNAYKLYSNKLKGRDHLGGQVVDGRIMLKRILTDICFKGVKLHSTGLG